MLLRFEYSRRCGRSARELTNMVDVKTIFDESDSLRLITAEQLFLEHPRHLTHPNKSARILNKAIRAIGRNPATAIASNGEGEQ